MFTIRGQVSFVRSFRNKIGDCEKRGVGKDDSRIVQQVEGGLALDTACSPGIRNISR